MQKKCVFRLCPILFGSLRKFRFALSWQHGDLEPLVMLTELQWKDVFSDGLHVPTSLPELALPHLIHSELSFLGLHCFQEASQVARPA